MYWCQLFFWHANRIRLRPCALELVPLRLALSSQYGLTVPITPDRAAGAAGSARSNLLLYVDRLLTEVYRVQHGVGSVNWAVAFLVVTCYVSTLRGQLNFKFSWKHHGNISCQSRIRHITAVLTFEQVVS